MSFYLELDGLSLKDLIDRLRISLDEAKQSGFYYEEVARMIRQQGEEGINFLKAEISSADTARLIAILSALAWPELDDSSLPGLFLSYLDDQRPEVVAEAIDGLSGQEVKEVVDKVLQLLNHNSPYVRGSVLRYMRRLYPDKSFQLLISALKDPHYIVRENAIDELDSLSKPEALPYIYPLLKDAHPHVRQAAQTAIDNLKDVEAFDTE